MYNNNINGQTLMLTPNNIDHT